MEGLLSPMRTRVGYHGDLQGILLFPSTGKQHQNGTRADAVCPASRPTAEMNQSPPQVAVVMLELELGSFRAAGVARGARQNAGVVPISPQYKPLAFLIYDREGQSGERRCKGGTGLSSESVIVVLTVGTCITEAGGHTSS
ncbi:unnamed protein product [Pleuronectes platessa]|uniref:Uncharacterized protein n=1 Tax=Pleuronectes platessa TaxID=8262 RepID=A0A9N7UFI4_PLEPL|nr:unnamed protein product [Pleuronectes platessa]